MDAQEFAARITQIQGRLYAIARLYLGNESMALEAVDEAVYHGLRSLRRLREPQFFNTWMTRILINECKKELRRRKREYLLEAIPEEATEMYDALPLKEAILHLPQELKEVIILRYFAGYTLAETSQILEIPQGTVVTRQRRALQVLRLALSEEA